MDKKYISQYLVDVVEVHSGNKCRRKLLYGVGVNDANYIVRSDTTKNIGICPYYSRWSNMLERCYSEKFLKTRPTYVNCTVCEEWLTFSVFKAWMQKQEWGGKALDKDILVEGNKKYSPSTCIFVGKDINNLLNDSRGKRGKHPLGVSYSKQKNKFLAKYLREGKHVHVGFFTTPAGAEMAYIKAKAGEILRVSTAQKDIRLRDALYTRAVGMVEVARQMEYA